MKKRRQPGRNKKRRRKPRWRHWYWFFVAGVLFLCYIFLLGNHGLIKYYQLQQRKQQLISQINQLKEEQQQLQKQIDMLQNNYRYIEKIAREKYQMGKPGEKIYFMIPPAEDNNKQN